MTLGWGILGTAGIADRAVAPAIASLDGAELVGVLSRDRSRAEQFARKHGGRSYDDFGKLLADPALDVVYVATPNALHADQVVAAAAAGKHVFCDKPLATSVADAKRAVQACRDAGVRLGVNFQSRHFGFVDDLRGVVRDGAIGEVVIAEIEIGSGRSPLTGWRSDKALAGLGAVNNLGVHVYDLLRYVLDAEVLEVSAMLDVGGRDELDTVALVLLRFSNGTLAYASANQAVRDFRPDLALYGTAGRIVGESVTRPGIDGVLRVLSSGGETVTPTSTSEAFRRSVKAFQDSVLESTEPNASGIDGLRSVELTEAIARSAREGCTIQLGPLP